MRDLKDHERLILLFLFAGATIAAACIAATTFLALVAQGVVTPETFTPWLQIFKR